MTPLDRARSIADVIEQDADTVEQSTRITPRIHQALIDSALYWIALPREYGGGDADIATCIAVVEEISRADGSTGWTYFVNLATIGGLFPFLREETLPLLFAGGERPIFAGQLVAKGRSEKVAGGYRCSGRHNFASGSAWANWICAMQFEHAGEAAVLDADGFPATTIALLRPAEVKFRGNWDVMGLAGTASYDYEVPEQVVPPERMIGGGILAPDARSLRGNAMLRMGALALAYSMHTACVLGIVRRAMQEIVALASSKTRAGYAGTIASDPVFLNAFAMADAEYHAVRGRVIDVFTAMEAKIAGGAMLDPTDHAIMHQTATWAHGKAGEIGGFCFRWAGTTPVRNPHPLARCMRDILVANSHMLFDAKSLTEAGPSLIARWTAPHGAGDA
jgi:alkylation response protein AidB-like acyl-CoA dehydrogenase